MSQTPRAEELPQVISVFPLDGALLLPHASRPFNIFEPRYLNMFDDVMAAERILGMVQTVGGGSPDRPRLAHTGCAGRVTSFNETSDGRYLVVLTGVCRFHMVDELSSPMPYRQVRADYAPFLADLEPLSPSPGPDRGRLMDLLRRYLEQHGLRIDWGAAEGAAMQALVNSLAMALPFDRGELQAILEAPGLEDRRMTLLTLLEIDGADGQDGAGHSRQ